MTEHKIYTTREVADMWRVSDRTIRNLCASGKLDSIRVGTQIRISEEAILKFNEENKNFNNEKEI